MAFPVLAGIPWLAAAIGAFFVALFQWLLNFLTRRVALVAAVVAIIAAVTVTFFAAIELLFAGISATAPEWVSTGATLVIPSNATACIAAIISAHVLKWAYSWQVRILQYKLF